MIHETASKVASNWKAVVITNPFNKNFLDDFEDDEDDEDDEY